MVRKLKWFRGLEERNPVQHYQILITRANCKIKVKERQITLECTTQGVGSQCETARTTDNHCSWLYMEISIAQRFSQSDNSNPILELRIYTWALIKADDQIRCLRVILIPDNFPSIIIHSYPKVSVKIAVSLWRVSWMLLFYFETRLGLPFWSVNLLELWKQFNFVTSKSRLFSHYRSSEDFLKI